MRMSLIEKVKLARAIARDRVDEASAILPDGTLASWYLHSLKAEEDRVFKIICEVLEGHSE